MTEVPSADIRNTIFREVMQVRISDAASNAWIDFQMQSACRTSSNGLRAETCTSHIASNPFPDGAAGGGLGPDLQRDRWALMILQGQEENMIRWSEIREYIVHSRCRCSP